MKSINEHLRTDSKVSKRAILVAVSIVGICLLLYIINLFVFFSIDSKNNEEKVKQYLQEYMKDTYGIESTLTLTNKGLINFACLFNFDGCSSPDGNINIYGYEFNGIDENEKEFFISYTNSYIRKFKYKDSEVYEDYYIYEQQERIDEYLSSISEKFNIFSSRDFEDHDILIYVDEFDERVLLDVQEKVDSFVNKSYYSIIFVNDMNSYRTLLRYRSTYENWPDIKSQLNVELDKEISIKPREAFNDGFLNDDQKVVMFEKGYESKSVKMYH